MVDAAVEDAPDFGPVLAQRAWCHSHRCSYLWTMQPEAARNLARADFDAALRLVGEHAPALTGLSATAAVALKDFRLSEVLARRALDIDPYNAFAWLRLGWVTRYLGRPHAALKYFDHSEAFRPLDPFLFNIAFGRSACLRGLKDFDGVMALIEERLRAAPRAQWACRMLFGTLWLQSDKKDAIAAG